MGVTIHFEGKLKSADALAQVIAIVEHFAAEENWPASRFKEASKVLERMDGEEEWNYEGPTQGIIIQPENTEPFILEFDNALYVQEYCKTQFAPIETHIQLIEILRAIEPYFGDLEVIDEGEYWNTDDAELLRKNIKDCFKAIEKAKKNDDTLDGPFVLESGRIIDLMQI